MNPHVLVISSSNRSNPYLSEKLIQLVQDSKSLETLLESLQIIPKKEISNSDALSAIALYGAKEEGATLDHLSLNAPLSPESLLEKVAQANSIVLASPVYFGDRSSFADIFLKHVQKLNALEGKAFSVISVGAKRNGGQETTNIYALFDAINMGGIGHGNGPRTSQYGGTTFAADRQAALKDELGIETTLGTGRRAAQVGRILKYASITEEINPLKVGVIITCDNLTHFIEHQTTELLKSLDTPHASYQIVNLLDYYIHPCLACSVCPAPKKVAKKEETGENYVCAIENKIDGMKRLYHQLEGIDALIMVGANLDNPNLEDHYQVFTERTRAIRRSDFEWTNTPFTSLIFKSVNANKDRLFGLRAMTSYLRHNTLVFKPIRSLEYQGVILSSPIKDLDNFLNWATKIRTGRNLAGPTNVSYTAGGPGGYSDNQLDHTSAKRT